MICSLHIHDIALIEDLTLAFGAGLHVMSGETGAGKSIVVDAVNFILGGRADRDLIRTGAEKGWVEAIFDAAEVPMVKNALEKQEVEWDGETVTVYRELNRNGRTLCRVCGVLTSLSFLREVCAFLMDVHGQHEHRFLMDSHYHLSCLDAFGGEAHQALCARVRADAESFLACHREYAHLVRDNEKKEGRLKEIRQSMAELKKAHLQDGEEERLQAEQEKLRHHARVTSALMSAYSALAQGDDGSVLNGLKTASRSLESITEVAPEFAALSARASSAFYELEDLSFELSSLMEKGIFDPKRAEQVDERLDLIRRLERKYMDTVPGILKRMQSMEQELDQYESMDDKLKEMAGEHRRLLNAYRSSSRSLSESRRALSAVFEDKIMGELRDLGMEKTIFQVCFAPEPARQKLPSPEGEDQVEFMISANPGEPLKPLSRVASGGELSRVMLALKSMEAERDGVGCMVFDEIDTGISGRIAQTVAEKMAGIARHRQVICVTHLPQIAAMADISFLVEKSSNGMNTHTHVRRLDPHQHVLEVARMLGGAEGSDRSAEEHAGHMIRSAGALKEQILRRASAAPD